MIAFGVAGNAMIVLLLVLLGTLGHALIPTVMDDNLHWSRLIIALMAAMVLPLCALAMAMVWRGEKSLVDIWLLVTLWASMLEVLLLLASPGRYTLGWYSGRIAGMLAGLFVLLALLIESGRLYLQFALSAALEQRQREGRLMSLDAAAGSIAHEVKQPIAAMATNAAAALIRIRRPNADLAKIEQTLEAIVDNAHRAADIVGAIRALFGSKGGEATAIDLNELIRETLELVAVSLSSRRIAVALDLDEALPQLMLQRQAMQQVILNLVTNAIDAADEATAPRRVSIRSGVAADKDVEIAIADTGMGIPDGEADRIFDAFYTTKTHGTGMGLPLCRSIVEAHGGRVWAEPGPARGAVFLIRIPLAAA